MAEIWKILYQLIVFTPHLDQYIGPHTPRRSSKLERRLNKAKECAHILRFHFHSFFPYQNKYYNHETLIRYDIGL